MQTLLAPPRDQTWSLDEDIHPHTEQSRQRVKNHPPSAQEASRALEAFLGWPQDRPLAQRPIHFWPAASHNRNIITFYTVDAHD